MSEDLAQNKERYGCCRICQKVGRLTKEHVPPASAFNDSSYRQIYVDVDEVNQTKRLQWKTTDVNQKGIYLFTLCERCNNKTGTWYGSDYAKFVRAFSSVAIPENANLTVEAHVKDFFPVRLVKQVVSMILSTSNPDSFEGYTAIWNPMLDSSHQPPPANAFEKLPDLVQLRTVYDEMRTFVKDRKARNLPPSVKLYAHAVANRGVGYRTGIFATGKRSTKKVCWGAYVGRWPINWLLVLDGVLDVELFEVTKWSSLDFKDKRSEKIQLPCRWLVGKYPLDFRSPKEFSRDGFVARMSEQGFVVESELDDEQLFADAISFARRRGKWTREGYLMTEFTSGSYFEAEGSRGWLEGMSRNEGREFLKKQFALTNKDEH